MYQGELKEMGRVDSLLKVRDVTQFKAEKLPAEAVEEIQQVVDRHGGKMLEVDNPRTTLEDLFLQIVRESEAHPGRRSSSQDNDGDG